MIDRQPAESPRRRVSDRLALTLVAVVAAAGVAFGVLVLHLSWPVALLIAGSPAVATSTGLLLKTKYSGRPEAQ
ncbi:hypothetical protein [Paractinoplanes maris]|uniref:hypothetical protein n=1 Tax=Paractinoplanes maris TaxID=1734446 RepID=UPI002020BA71|nr:hypothetical protein [Actinoplanes maris]